MGLSPLGMHLVGVMEPLGLPPLEWLPSVWFMDGLSEWLPSVWLDCPSSQSSSQGLPPFGMDSAVACRPIPGFISISRCMPPKIESAPLVHIRK
uniref:Uncharacterized protein n=1 Tax=Picea glauca TaxID=3330 RepID=A0A101LZP2_PICGL|nr:hypothetical protein ABT39_MTgene5237 [Picea glauca]QHR89169.1 hypothetical protein Q903MT_gene3189 [Picea sitchensis]